MRSRSSSSAGFTVLTGETGAGKSILLDALGLLLGDRFELRQLRPAPSAPSSRRRSNRRRAAASPRWLAEQELAAADGEVLLRRVLDAQGRSRAWINGRPATLAQLDELGEMLVDMHGQHAHQALIERRSTARPARRVRRLHDAARRWRDAWRSVARRGRGARDAAATAAEATAAERDGLAERARASSQRWRSAASEWADLSAAQRGSRNAAEPDRGRCRRPRTR